MNREALDYREIDQFSIDYWESVDCNDVVADPDVVKDDSADESDLEELERQVNSWKIWLNNFFLTQLVFFFFFVLFFLFFYFCSKTTKLQF